MIPPLSYYSVVIGNLTWSAQVRRLGPNIMTGNRLVAGICVKGVTRLTRLVMERGFVGLEWGPEGLVPNIDIGVQCHILNVKFDVYSTICTYV